MIVVPVTVLVVVVVVVVVVVISPSGGNFRMDEVGMTLLAQARFLLYRRDYLRL